jgi:hypothetical protein
MEKTRDKTYASRSKSTVMAPLSTTHSSRCRIRPVEGASKPQSALDRVSSGREECSASCVAVQCDAVAAGVQPSEIGVVGSDGPKVHEGRGPRAGDGETRDKAYASRSNPTGDGAPVAFPLATLTPRTDRGRVEASVDLRTESAQAASAGLRRA